MPPKETTKVLMWAKRSSPKTLLWVLDAFVCVLPQSCSGTNCDRTTSEMRGLSPKITSGDSRRSENAQTQTYKHTVPCMKFKLKLLQIKCHVLEFTKYKAQNVPQRIIIVFAEAFVSHDRHALRPRREWASSDDLHLWVPVGNSALISPDLPLIALVSIARRRRKILTCTEIHKKHEQKLEQLCLTRLIRRDLKTTNSRHARLQVNQRT
jgi:hypothetical protein